MTRFCPEGDGAFDDRFTTCPNCGRPLTDQPPRDEADDTDDPRLVRLATAANEPEAQMWAETLRRQDIAVFVRPGGPGVGAWASVASFEHDLFVRERDLPAARKLSRSLLAESAPARRLVPRRRTVPTSRPARRPGRAG